MDDFIDINGASGARYRFRLAPGPTALPNTAGNFIFVRRDAKAAVVVGCGSANALNSAAKFWAEAVNQHQAEAMYVHLNISHRDRLRVHEDLVAQYQPPIVASE